MTLRNGYKVDPNDSDKYEHIAIAERALGRPLPKKSHVHHADLNPLNNTPSNLVICPTAAYHRLLHARTRVVDAGGDPQTQKLCGCCQQLLQKDAFSFKTRIWDGRSDECRKCTNERRRGKGYGEWSEHLKKMQQLRRARAKASLN